MFIYLCNYAFNGSQLWKFQAACYPRTLQRDLRVLKVRDLEPTEWQTLRLSDCFFSSAAQDCTSNRWSWCASPLTESCMNLSLCLWSTIITWWLAIIVQGCPVSHPLCARTRHNPPTSATPTPLSRASFGSKCATCPSKMNSAYHSVLYRRLNNNLNGNDRTHVFCLNFHWIPTLGKPSLWRQTNGLGYATQEFVGCSLECPTLHLFSAFGGVVETPETPGEGNRITLEHTSQASL